MTEWLHFHLSLSCIGEGNGNPLQCSCLENPRDGGTWWTAVYRVAQSRTRLKWLSTHAMSMLVFWLIEFSRWLIVRFGEGNGTPLQYSCLENPMDTGVLTWRIPGTGEPGGLPSLRLHRVGHYWSDLAAAAEAQIYGYFLDFCKIRVYRLAEGILEGRRGLIW